MKPHEHEALYFSRWVSLAACLLIGSLLGIGYAFALFTHFLKTTLHFDQPEVDLIGNFNLAGGYIGLIGGVLFDAVGPRPTVVLSAFVSCAGLMATRL